MSEPRKPPFRTTRSGGAAGRSSGGPSRSRSGFGGGPRPEHFMPEEESSAHELLEMADNLTRQARELTAYASRLRRLAADLQEGAEERPRPSRGARTGGGARGAGRAEGRGGFGSEERPRKRAGEAPAWAPKKRKR